MPGGIEILRLTTFAGTGKAGNTADGAPIAGTPLKGPRSLDFDKDGNLRLATREGNQDFKFDSRPGKSIISPAAARRVSPFMEGLQSRGLERSERDLDR